MRHFLSAITIGVLLLLSITTQGKVRCTPIYIFGTSASFNDSVVYITEIQILDSAWVDEKSGFLEGRSGYSNQLKNHFSIAGNDGRTNLVSFATTEKAILKKYERMRKKFHGTKKHPLNYDIRILDEEEFRFTTEQHIGNEEAIIDAKANKRAEKSKKKKESGTLNTPRREASDNELPPTIPPRH